MGKQVIHMKVYSYTGPAPEINDEDCLARECDYNESGLLVSQSYGIFKVDYLYNPSGDLLEEILTGGETRKRRIYEYNPDGELFHVHSQWEILLDYPEACSTEYVSAEKFDAEVLDNLGIPFITADEWLSWRKAGVICEHSKIIKSTNGSTEESRTVKWYDNEQLVRETNYDIDNNISLDCIYSYQLGILFQKIETYYIGDDSRTCITNYVDDREVSRRNHDGSVTSISYDDDDEGNWIHMKEIHDGQVVLEHVRVIDYR